MTTTPPKPAGVPLPLALVNLAIVLAVPVLSSYGITNPEIPRLARDLIPPSAALVLAVIALAHHWTAVQFGQLAATLATVAQTAVTDLTTPAPDAPPPAAPVALVGASAIEAAAVLAAVQDARAGVLAVGPTGRHEAAAPLSSDAPTDVLSVPLLPPVPTPRGSSL